MFRFLTVLMMFASLLGCLTEQEPTDVDSNWNAGLNKNGVTPDNGSSSLLIPSTNTYPRAIVDNVNVMEDSSIVLQSILTNDTDVDGDNLTILGFSQGSEGGKVEKVSENLLKYVPPADFNGQDVIEYTISDGNGGESTAQINITVESVNDLPLAKPDRLLVDMDVGKSFNILINDVGLGDVVSIEVIEGVTYGTLSYQDNGDFAYIPFTDYMGEDGFVYEITDSNGDTSIARVTLQVGCNDACRVFTLSWDASISTDVVAYKVYMGVDGQPLSPLADIGDVMKYEYFTHEIGEYVFAVTAINAQSIESELSAPQAASF